MPTQSQTFRFERLDKIGSADAEEDRDFLRACFLDTGALRVLRDCADPRRIVVGRTGSGKTALLLMLADTEPQVIDIKPESLALGHISNSTILPFFVSVGVNLDLFYKLLWRHVLAIELLKRHYNYQGADAPRTLFSTLRQMFRNEKQRRAIDYLEKWGDKFWKEPEDRIKEVTKKLEEELKAEAKAALPGALNFSVAAAHHLTEEQKHEVAQRAQAVVNRVQIRELSEILDLVNDILSSDRQKRYYVTIDRLDEGWIDDYHRFKLIRALIEQGRASKDSNRFAPRSDRACFPSHSRQWVPTLTDDICEEFCLNFVIARLSKSDGDDIIAKNAQAVVECVLAATSFKKTLMSVFYRVGLIGLKLERHDKVNWASSGRTGVSDAEVSESVTVAIHPAFWRVFGIKTQKH